MIKIVICCRCESTWKVHVATQTAVYQVRFCAPWGGIFCFCFSTPADRVGYKWCSSSSHFYICVVRLIYLGCRTQRACSSTTVTGTVRSCRMCVGDLLALSLEYTAYLSICPCNIHPLYLASSCDRCCSCCHSFVLYTFPLPLKGLPYTMVWCI